MRIILTLLLLVTIQLVHAQSKGKISGIIHSSENIPLEKATISLIDTQDSSVLSYSLSTDKGKFEFIKIPLNKDLLLYITHVNAATYQQKINLNDPAVVELGIIKLEGKQLEEVVVTAQPPVRMNKDTLEYNADYFKTRPNANVEELLKQLPGLQVNMDGTIYYEGKEVSNVKVNGKDFFASDLKIATRNLDASLVKTIQVYRDKGESKKTVDDEEKLPITINLKFKKEFLRSDFGKIYASGGTRERYEAGALLNTFRDTLQISFIGYGNNINRQSFDYSELSQHAGLGRSENYGFQDFGGQNYYGIANDMGAGINTNYDWGKLTKLNIMYMLKRNESMNKSIGVSESLYDGVTQRSAYDYQSEEKSLRHQVTTMLRHRFDSTSFLEFRPNLDFNNNTSTGASNANTLSDGNPLNSSINNSTGKNRTLNYRHTFTFEKLFAKVHLFNFSNNFSSSNSRGDNWSRAKNIINTDSLLNRDFQSKNINNSHNQNLLLSVGYTNQQIKKLNFNLYFTYNQDKNKPEEELYSNIEQAELIRFPQFENNFRYFGQNYISGIKFFWKPLKNLNLNFGTAYQIKENDFNFYDIDSKRKTQDSYWLPNIEIRFKDFNGSWSRDVSSPSTYSIRTQDNTLQPLYTSLQSLVFDNSLKTTTNFSYQKYTQKIQMYFNYNRHTDEKSVGYKSWRTPSTGQYLSQSYQSGPTTSNYITLQFRYRFNQGKDWNFYISTRPYYQSYEHYQSINSLENKITRKSLNLTQEFSIEWKSRIAIIPVYKHSINFNRNSIQDNPDFTESDNISKELGVGLNITNIKGFTLESSYMLQNRQSGLNERKNYHLVNSSLYYNFKNNAQIKLSVYDLLNQNNSNNWGTNSNTTYYNNSSILRQYFLLGYVHKFSKTKTK